MGSLIWPPWHQELRPFGQLHGRMGAAMAGGKYTLYLCCICNEAITMSSQIVLGNWYSCVL